MSNAACQLTRRVRYAVWSCVEAFLPRRNRLASGLRRRKGIARGGGGAPSGDYRFKGVSLTDWDYNQLRRELEDSFAATFLCALSTDMAKRYDHAFRLWLTAP